MANADAGRNWSSPFSFQRCLQEEELDTQCLLPKLASVPAIRPCENVVDMPTLSINVVLRHVQATDVTASHTHLSRLFSSSNSDFPEFKPGNGGL